MPAIFSIAAIVLLAFTAFICHQLSFYTDCEGAPYLYVTFHGLHGVRKYSRDGCLLSENILHGKNSYVIEGRQIRNAEYLSKPALYVVEAETTHHLSNVYVFGNCNKNGYRTYKSTVTSQLINPGATHPYAMDFDSNGNIYISFQNSDVVLRFTKDTFHPMDPPNGISQPSSSLYAGTFYEFPKGVNDQTSNTDNGGIRGIRFVKDNLWIANEKLKEIYIVNMNGIEIHKISLHPQSPIAIYYSDGTVYVSTKGSTKGVVYAINPSTRDIIQTYYAPNMIHNSGIVTYKGILYVGSQNLKNIITFDINSGKVIDSDLISGTLPDLVESLELSDC
jgi:outer membrane protein assembly factor BamB